MKHSTIRAGTAALALAASTLVTAPAMAGTSSVVCDDGTTCFAVGEIVNKISLSTAPFRNVPLGQDGYRLADSSIHFIARAHYHWCNHHPAICTQAKYREPMAQQVADCGVFGCWWPDFSAMTRCAQGSMFNFGCSAVKTVFATEREILFSDLTRVTFVCGGMAAAAMVGQPEITGGMLFSAGGKCAVGYEANHYWPFSGSGKAES